MAKFNVRIAKSPRDWYGFSVPEGAAFGSEYLTSGDFESKKYYDYVYLGQNRVVKRPDGTVCGREVKIFLHHHDDATTRFDKPDAELFRGYFQPVWFFCAKGSLAEKLLNRHIKTVKRPKPDNRAELRNFHIHETTDMSSAIKRPSSAGAIFAMIRNGQ